MTFNDNPSDAPSIAKFFQKEYDGLFRYALHVAHNDPQIAMDAVSESFKTIIANYDRYRDYPNGCLFNYMMSMVHNKVLKELQAQKRICLAESLEEIPDNDEDPVTSYFRSVDETLLEQCVAELAPKHQMVIKMYYFDDASLEDVGRALDMTEESARVTLWRIRKKLKALYLKKAEERWDKDEKEKSGT